MQSYTEIPSSQSLADSLDDILNNDKTGISCSSGSSFPTTNLQQGMLCYRTDESKVYQLTATSPSATWKELMDYSSGTGVAPSASGLSGTVTDEVVISVSGTDPALKVTQAGTGDAFRVEDVASDTTPFVIDDEGKVGVQVSAPAYPLDVLGTVNSSGGSSYAFLGSTSNDYVARFDSTDANAYITMEDSNSTVDNGNRFGVVTDAWKWFNAGTNTMNLLGTGRLGINQASPSGMLHVAGTAADPDVYLENTGDSTAARSDSINFDFDDGVGAKVSAYRAGGGAATDVYLRYFTGGTGTERFRMEADGDFHADGDIIAYSTTISDERLKDDIQVVENALDKVKQIRGVTFTYNTDGKEAAGVIAQEVEKVLPQAVSDKELPLKKDDGETYKVVQYDALHALLIEAVKELSAEVEKLKGER